MIEAGVDWLVSLVVSVPIGFAGTCEKGGL